MFISSTESMVIVASSQDDSVSQIIFKDDAVKFAVFFDTDISAYPHEKNDSQKTFVIEEFIDIVVEKHDTELLQIMAHDVVLSKHVILWLTDIPASECMYFCSNNDNGVDDISGYDVWELFRHWLKIISVLFLFTLSLIDNIGKIWSFVAPSIHITFFCEVVRKWSISVKLFTPFVMV